MDFQKLLSRKDVPLPIEPRKLYSSLNKVSGYGYLRDVQGQILVKWHEKRSNSDLIVKANTGGGKTINGLIILQSYMNEGLGPGLYVAPSKQLVNQVRDEAKRIGILTVEDPDDPRYLRSEAIAVVNSHKLFNGKSVFSDKRPSGAAPIGSVVIDDTHAALPITRDSLSIRLDSKHAAYGELLKLFEADLEASAPIDLLDIKQNTAGGLARVPIWAWHLKLPQARALLHNLRESTEIRYAWPAISEVLPLCRVVFTGKSLTISPLLPPVRHVTSFAKANRRVYLTATLADDSVLVSEFSANAETLKDPITPSTSGDIGERMILAPQEINPSIIVDDIRAAIVQLATNVNVVVLVPSKYAAQKWNDLGAIVAEGDDITQIVDRLRGSHLGLVVLVNRYDGIDLPEDACRVLVLDGLPQSFSPDEHLQARLTGRADGIDDRQVQRIEQGMGRGVRSNEDHCVIFLLGTQLSRLIADPRSATRFGRATRAQIDLSREITANFVTRDMDEIIATVHQALGRDRGWVDFARQALVDLEPPAPSDSVIATARRNAFELATDKKYDLAVIEMDNAVNASTDKAEQGWLKEEQAHYANLINPERAQEILRSARALNQNVTMPLAGVAFKRLKPTFSQAKKAARFFEETYPNAVSLQLGFHEFLEDLRFDNSRTKEFEEALRKLGLHLGLSAERPEKTRNEGPDGLWGLGTSNYWVIEAKSGVMNGPISKRDLNQLTGSANWFEALYGDDIEYTPVMIHKSTEPSADGSPHKNMKVITESTLEQLKKNVRAFSSGVSQINFDRPGELSSLLSGHKLLASDLASYLEPVRFRR